MRRYKEFSHHTIDEIRKQQYIHRKDIVQPRVDDEINPEFVQVYGAKNLNPTSQDVRKMYRKSSRLAKVLDNKRRQQYG